MPPESPYSVPPILRRSVAMPQETAFWSLSEYPELLQLRFGQARIP